ncbi:CPBP family glutamic-type intramembrane protease [Myroides sp. N17-2]|uniref:CPBP family glutamic-type intramembrane protease n=1 Tax=Myroides sp. N17-2 TaxID=2030799 RepID=UPI000EFD3099|nr:CPBP family glutamic-type intramembrane protease [Myroides sp. N17-2]
MNISNIVKDFIQYLKKPDLACIVATKTEKIVLVFRLWLISLFTIVLLGVVIDQMIDVPTPDLFDIKLKELGVPLFVLFVTIFGPLFEEITFRLPLRYKPSYLIISFVFIAFYIVGSISKISDSVTIGLTILFTVLFLLLNYFISQKGDKSQSFYIKYYPYIFYGLAVVFGYVHIANFEEVNTRILLLSPLIVLPQLITGLGMGYVRVRLGFWYGVFFHILHNSAITAVMYLGGYFDI